MRTDSRAKFGAVSLAARSLPARVDTASHILALIDDPETNVVRLAAAVGADPTITARVIALANSAYYGLSRRVSTVQYSISVVGFEAVRAIAVPICLGLDGARPVPEGFWKQAAVCAVAAGLIAPALGAEPAEAFCTGLLLTIGSAALHQHADLPGLCLPSPVDTEAFLRRETDIYGIDHAMAGADLLARWNVPAPICAAVGQHHADGQPDDPPLLRVVHTARMLTDLHLSAESGSVISITSEDVHGASGGRLEVDEIDELSQHIAERADALLVALS